MRFIGNKENLLDTIHQTMKENSIDGVSFFDCFAGTTSVGRYFKKMGYKVFSADLLYFSYVLQRAYITNNNTEPFTKLIKKIDTKNGGSLFPTNIELIATYLSKVKPKAGFIYKNYSPTGTKKLSQPRMYFTDENGKKIDAIRSQIENWHTDKLITEDEYFILLACLIETVPFYSNTTGVYGAFQKKWDPRAIKPLRLRSIELIRNKHKNESYNADSTDLIENIDADIYYLDPPYNQRQYAPNYHVLETIAKYDNPKIKGVTGMRDYSDQKSNFCNARTALAELDKIAKNGKFKHLVLSYNSEGIMPTRDIISVLSKYGTTKLEEFVYNRYKSNNNGEAKNKKYIKEQLFLLNKYE